MAATANMILKITTLADVAGLKAGLDMVAAFGGKVLEVMKAVDDFSDAHSRLSLDVSKMVSATKGMIAAQDAYAVANKLSAAGIKATAEQLEGLGKKATEYAQATGQDIPTALQQMTQAVMAGSARGLKPFGVDVSEAKDKLDAANMALNKFAEEMAGVTIQIDSLSNMIEALGTNIGDAAKRMAELSGASAAVVGPLQELNDALTYFNEMMEIAPNAMMKFTTNLKGLGAEVGRSFIDLISNVLAPLEVIVGVISAPIIALAEAVGLGDINPISALRSALELAKEKLSALGAGAVSQLAYDVQLETAGKNATGKTAVGDALGAAAGGAYAESVASAKSAIKPAKKRGGGGGGRGRDDEYTGAIDSQTGMSEEFATEDLLSNADGDRYSGASATVDQMIADEQAKENLYGPPMSEADATASIEAMTAWMDVRQAQMELEISFAGSFAESWSSALGKTSAGAMVAAGSQNMLRGAVTMAANAIVGSSKLTVKSVAEMVKGVALSIGIEATILGLIELGHMIAAAASSWGMSPEVEMHAAALAQYAITAAAAFAVAGGAGAIGGAGKGSGASPTGTRTGQGSYGSPGYSDVSGGGDKQVNVSVTLQGDAGGVFRVVDEENERRSRNGQSTIKSAA